MPEGPEIRREADAISRAIAGRRIERIFFAFDALKHWEAPLTGQRLVAVDTLGKHMLCRFEDGTRIHSHNQLYGRWWVTRGGHLPDTGRELRLALHGARRSALLYSASDIEVLSAEELEEHPRLSALGPDPLDRDVDRETAYRRLVHETFRRRRVAGLLLDQRFMAGLGNYLRSEILFHARVHPALRPIDCEDRQLRRLAAALIDIPRRSYRTGGATNSPHVVRGLRAQGLQREDYRFSVFARAEQACYRCAAPILAGRASGRRIYHCPACQPGSDV